MNQYELEVEIVGGKHDGELAWFGWESDTPLSIDEVIEMINRRIGCGYDLSIEGSKILAVTKSNPS